jgi:hypothetical protein
MACGRHTPLARLIHESTTQQAAPLPMEAITNNPGYAASPGCEQLASECGRRIISNNGSLLKFE